MFGGDRNHAFLFARRHRGSGQKENWAARLLASFCCIITEDAWSQGSDLSQPAPASKLIGGGDPHAVEKYW